MLHHIPMRQKIIVMIAVMTGLFLVALDQMIITTALKSIVDQFNSYSSIGLVVTAYLLFSTVTVPIAGKFSDMFGRKPVLLTGVVVFTIGSLLSGSSQSIIELIAWRSLQGFGGGIIMANAFTIIGDLFTPRERGRWQGIFSSVFGLASIVGPLLGGWLTSAHHILSFTTDWRWTFWINIPFGILATIVIAIYCPSIRHDKKPQIDYAGAIALTVALASLVLAVDNTDVVFKFLADTGWNLDTIKAILYGISGISAVLFVLIEQRAKEPTLSLAFFKKRNFSVVMAIMTLFGAAFLGSILYLTQFNQQVFGADPEQAGLMLLPMIGGLMAASMTSGQIVSRTGHYKGILVGGFAVATLGVFALTTLTPSAPYWHEAIMMAFTGIGLGMAMPIMNLAVQNEFEQKDLGAATASTQLFRGLGSTVGTAVLSGVLTAGITAHFVGLQTDPFIQEVKQSPAASKIFTNGKIDANSALALNQAKSQISSAAHKQIEAIQLPSQLSAPAQSTEKQKLINQFNTKQNHFSSKITDAFSKSMQDIFYISSGLMAVGFAGSFLVREKTLKGADILGAPGAA